MMSSFGAIHDDINDLKPAKEFLQKQWNVLTRPVKVNFPIFWVKVEELYNADANNSPQLQVLFAKYF